METENRRRKRRIARSKQSMAIKSHILNKKVAGCQLCGYNKCLAAVEFHHVNGDKLFEISKVGGRSFKQVDTEVDKCVVVCANCHREIHESENGIVNNPKPHKEEKQGDLLL